jgi:hypothetical protein
VIEARRTSGRSNSAAVGGRLGGNATSISCGGDQPGGAAGGGGHP